MYKKVLKMALRATVKSAALRAFSLLCFVMLSVVGMKAQTPYAIWCEDNSTLYFTNSNETYAAAGTYDGQTITQVWSGDAVVNYGEQPQWNTVVGKNCTKVVFDQSFYEIKPTSLKRWFTHFYNPALQFVGLNYLNTSEVTDMSYMFEGSNRLKSLDLSSFNTGKVTTMKGMFRDCLSLTSLDLSSFNTQNVTDMSEMFLGCKYLTSLDLDNFNTSKVSDMSSMFENCKILTNLNISSFNTENVTSMANMFNFCDVLPSIDLSRFNTEKVSDMSRMFFCCFGLTTLDLSSFNTQNVTSMKWMFSNSRALTSLDLSNFKTDNVKDMNQMFLGCSELKTIYCNNDWNTDLVEDDENMFYNCASLVGGNGTAYDSNHTGKDYARIDREDAPGYFTSGPVAYAIWCEGNSTFYFTYSNETYAADGTYDGQTITKVWSGDAVVNIKYSPSWDLYEIVTKCTKVKIDQSFSKVKPKNLRLWFGFKHKDLQIEGLNYLDTSEATNMSGMFDGKFTSLDLSNFNTAKVTNMQAMFANCSNLQNLDLSSFNTENVTNMAYMFYKCNNLKTIYVGNDWNIDSVEDEGNMFEGCASLVGGNGTAYDSNQIGKDYARIDREDAPGYFTKLPYALWCEGNSTLYFVVPASGTYAAGDTYNGETITQVWSGDAVVNYGEQPQWNTVVGKNCTKVVFDQSFYEVKPTSLKRWLADFYNPALQFVGLNYLNTSEVTDMSYMFQGTNRLKSLDLSSFNTGKVTTMKGMFRDCLSLTSLDLSSFNTQNVTDMSEMFMDCHDLTSLNLGNFNTSKVADMTSMFDNCRALTNLNISSFNTENVTSMANMFSGCEVLPSFDLSRFNTEKVSDMSRMFSCCYVLTTLDLSSFNTQNVTSMKWMFSNSRALTSLDLSNFKTDNVKDMNQMFFECKKLKTIYCNNDWNTDLVEDDENMFEDCTSLVGGNGTAYDSNHTGKDYARIDREDAPGYFMAFAENYEYTISNAMVGTYYSLVPLTIPEDVDYFDAFYVTSISESGTIHLKKLKNVIPAITGVVIFGNEGTYTLNVAHTSDYLPIENNLLKGVDKETSVKDLEQENGTDIYVLSRGQNSYIGFRKAGGAVKTIPANRAYLPYTSPSGASRLTITFENEDVTGIADIDGHNNSGETIIYNLAGQRVKKTQHGIYIVNGKKVYIH